MDEKEKTGVLRGYYRVEGSKKILGLGSWPRAYYSEEQRIVINGADSGLNEQDTKGKAVRGRISPRIN